MLWVVGIPPRRVCLRQIRQQRGLPTGLIAQSRGLRSCGSLVLTILESRSNALRPSICYYHINDRGDSKERASRRCSVVDVQWMSSDDMKYSKVEPSHV